MRADTNTDAIERCVRENEDDLYRYFRRRFSNDADAAEAFGETLLTLWKLRRRIPTDGQDARLWLFGVARNVARTTQRSLARHSQAVGRFVDEMRESAATSPGSDEAIEVRHALGKLNPDDAELIRLIYWDGFHSHEAAIVLGVSASAARSRLAKARATLRAELEVEAEIAVTRGGPAIGGRTL